MHRNKGTVWELLVKKKCLANFSIEDTFRAEESSHTIVKYRPRAALTGLNIGTQGFVDSLTLEFLHLRVSKPTNPSSLTIK